MKKFLLFSLISLTILMVACDKGTTLPAYTPPVTTNFTVTSLKHTKDSVNVGDTVYLTAAGTVYDTTQTINAFLVTTYTASGVSYTYNYGSAAAPVKLARTIGASTNGVYAWTATILLPGATFVPHKTKLTITGNFTYGLSLSSMQGTLVQADAVPTATTPNKVVYVR